jgi:hypothetical protein
MAHCLDQSTLAIPWGGYRARFLPDPVILLLDGHYSHTRNLEVNTLAQENHVDIICLPPHGSHKMHPLDRTFMGPLKTFYWQEV